MVSVPVPSFESVAPEPLVAVTVPKLTDTVASITAPKSSGSLTVKALPLLLEKVRVASSLTDWFGFDGGVTKGGSFWPEI